MKHLTDRIAEFVYEDLSFSEMTEAERHLKECSVCREEVDQFQRTNSMLKSMQDVEPPRKILFEVEKPARTWAWRWLSPAGAAVAASIITALLMTPATPPAISPVTPTMIQEPVAQAIDYDRIIESLRASQDERMDRELAKRDVAHAKEIQRVRGELAYLETLQLGIRRDTYENATSIQMLAQKTELRD